ncbi:MAG TPA: hypothetical protein VNT75_07120 [Symbiobacteriaceae bacterium]|nr:hypothetical protein [Symbiobacteriaceae bacterium]
MYYLFAVLAVPGYLWWAFLIPGVALLIWAGAIAQDGENPRKLALRRWLKGTGWFLLCLMAVGLLIRSVVSVD